MDIAIGFHSEDTGQTLYALLFDANAQLLNASSMTFEAYSGTLDDYDFPLTEGDARYYEAVLTGAFSSGNYTVRVYSQADASPDLSADDLLTVRRFYFDAEAEKEITDKELYEKAGEASGGGFIQNDRDILYAIYGQARLRMR